MATINDMIIQASELRPGISRLLRNSTYPRYGDLSGLEINYEDGEQLFLIDKLRGIMENYRTFPSLDALLCALGGAVK